jgi:type II secretory pathway component GspD/PulD (secretin)
MSTIGKQLSSARPAVGQVLLLWAGLLVAGLTGCCHTPPAPAEKKTYSSFDLPTRRAAQTELAAGSLNLQSADLDQVLSIYQELSGRTVIRGPLPRPAITVRNQTPLTRVQALQLLDTALAQNGIAMVLAGDTAVKAVPNAMAASEGPPEITLPWEALPDSSSFMSRTVHLKKVRASELVPALMPFAKTPNALLPIDAGNLLIIRDYSANVRRMLQVLQELETNAKP